MKRITLAITILIALVLIVVGNYSWNQEVEKTVKEAEEKISATKIKESIPNGSSDPIEKETTPSLTEEDLEANKSESEAKRPTPDGDQFDSTDSFQSKIVLKDNAEKYIHNNNEEKKPSLAEIKSEYQSIFTELEIQETSKVDQLVVEAKADFVSGQGSLDQLITKYQAAAQLLEQNANNSFNVIYQQLQYDLESNGYDVNEAEEFKQSYNTKKQERRTRIFSQIQDF